MSTFRRVTLALICVIAGAQPGPLPVQKIDPPKGQGVEFSARVLDAVTGDPIPEVLIELTRATTGADRRSWVYSAQTDVKGRWVSNDLAADRYAINVTLKGRTLVSGSERTTVLTSGKATSLIFRMFPSSTIEGTVEDRDRKPIPGARVELLEERWTAGQRTLTRMLTSEQTDAEGKYTLTAVLPGTYYLRARINPGIIQQQLKDTDALQDPEARHVAYVHTLYPNAPFLEMASPVIIYPGSNRQGVRIEVQKSKHYTVRGNIKNLAPEVRTPGLIFIRTVSFDSRFPFIADSPYDESIRTNIAANGDFSYDLGIPPGQYWMGYTPGGQANRFGGMDFRVTDRDVELKTELWEGFPFEGKMVYEDGTPVTGIVASSRTFWARRSIREDSFRAGADGKFNQPLYSDGTFRIGFDAPVAVVKIEKDSKTYFGPEFEIVRNGGPAVITLTKKGATINGSVELHNSTKAYPRGMVTLSLDPANPLDNPRRKRLDGTNTFAFEHLEAGRFRLCSWVEEGTEINRVLGNPNYDRRLANLCQTVEVKIDESKSASLKQISALDIQ